MDFFEQITVIIYELFTDAYERKLNPEQLDTVQTEI